LKKRFDKALVIWDYNLLSLSPVL